jgi:hypothetical protein
VRPLTSLGYRYDHLGNATALFGADWAPAPLWNGHLRAIAFGLSGWGRARLAPGGGGLPPPPPAGRLILLLTGRFVGSVDLPRLLPNAGNLLHRK